MSAPLSSPGQPVKRVNEALTSGSLGAAEYQLQPAIARLIAVTVVTTIGCQRRRRRTAGRVPVVPLRMSRPNARSRADWNRASRGFSTQRAIVRASVGDTVLASISG